MKLLILGGGSCQLNVIKRARQKGHTVIVADYYPDAPGKKYAHYGELVSTFDIEGCLEVARKYAVDGILTVGTDQPVYTAAVVANQTGLPFPINMATARAVTNKKVMKETFRSYGIPTVDFRILERDFTTQELAGLKFPVVIKPLDSQGQRGVFKLNSTGEVREYLEKTLSFSREKEFLLESYYESAEITVSGWVIEGRPYLLTVTDRITFEKGPHIGICSAHNFPSRFLKLYLPELERVSLQIVQGFKIINGPIYFQMLIGEEGLKVNEIACRIGGAYEDIFIPHLTGVDILDMAIDYALGKDPELERLVNYSLVDNDKWFSTRLFFARPGIISRTSKPSRIRQLPGVVEVGFNYKPGDEIAEIENATQRAGYLLVEGKSRKELEVNLQRALAELKIYNQRGENLLIC